MDGTRRSDIRPGLRVLIVLKSVNREPFQENLTPFPHPCETLFFFSSSRAGPSVAEWRQRQP